MHIFADPLPATVSREQLEKSSKSLSIQHVVDWVERHDNVKGRFQFFETFAADNEFYLKVGKPLCSLGTVGSMLAERRIKAVKHEIMTKKRNRLLDPKGVVLMRCAENLNHITNAKKMLGKKVTDSL